MEKEKVIIKWNDMSNTYIKHELESIKEYHSSLKLQITKLLDKIDYRDDYLNHYNSYEPKYRKKFSY